MKFKISMHRIICGAFFLLANLAVSIPANAVNYSIIDLGTLGGNLSSAADINNNGQVVGFSSTNFDPSSYDHYHAFLYSNGVMNDLGALGGGQSYALGINNSGQIVGADEPGPAYYNPPFLYSGGVMNHIGGNQGYAFDINDLGQAVGWNINDDGFQSAFLYSGGIVTDLGYLGGNYSTAQGLNNLGQVVGETGVPNDFYAHAFLYSNGIMTDIGVLPGGNFSSAEDINDLGQIVGLSHIDGDNYHAFIYSGGIMTDLGTLTGNGNSRAYGINNLGQVVGQSDATNTPSLYSTAFLYSEGIMHDLNDLLPSDSGWALGAASSINDKGQIVGYGLIEGEIHAFLMNPAPVPVPSAAWLFGSGILGLSAVARRRSGQQPRIPKQ